MHTLPLQVLPPQHCEELVQAEPSGEQPERPWQTPLLQVSVPQQSAEREQLAPSDEQSPSEQILLALQVSVPQQSPLLLQTESLPWQGPTAVTSGILMSS